MRVLSYNIQEGGGDRLERIADVIRRQRPDAVALQEAKSQQHVVVLARNLGMELVFGEANSACHVAWLSRLPILRRENHRLTALSKTLLEIEVNWEGRSLSLFATHLASRHDPGSPDQEMLTILDVLHGVVDLPHVLVGDLNSLRPGDPIGRPPSGEKLRGDAVAGAARQAIRSILESGYTDCYRAVHADAGGYTYPSAAPWLRLDYIFASPQIAARLRECDVVQTEEAEGVSDHFPVWAEYQ